MIFQSDDLDAESTAVQAGVQSLPELPEAIPLTMDCEDCMGHGFVGEPRYMGEFQPPEHEECSSCGGTGKWKVASYDESMMRAYATEAIAAERAEAVRMRKAGEELVLATNYKQGVMASFHRDGAKMDFANQKYWAAFDAFRAALSPSQGQGATK